MRTALHFMAPAGPCGYLPEETWQLEYEVVRSLTPREYTQRMRDGWRRFGRALFRPRCPQCTACQALRVVVDQFQPNRSQRRNRRSNSDEIRLQIGSPVMTRAKVDLYDRFHAQQSSSKGWPAHRPKDPESYHESFIDQPFPTQEWCYFLGQELVGVGYMDDLPEAISAIYFFYDPAHRARGLGTWNVLSVLAYAARRHVPHVYLGYYVAGCESMAYKAGFAPNEVRGTDGEWRAFRT